MNPGLCFRYAASAAQALSRLSASSGLTLNLLIKITERRLSSSSCAASVTFSSISAIFSITSILLFYQKRLPLDLASIFWLFYIGKQTAAAAYANAFFGLPRRAAFCLQECQRNKRILC